MKLKHWIMGAALAAFAANGALAQPEKFDHRPKKVTPLGSGVYMIEGTMWNLTAAIAKDGVLLIDDSYPQVANDLRAELAKLTPNKVRWVVNTHFHRDHNGGNESFAKDGAIIIGQAGLRARMSVPYDNASGGSTPAPPPIARPAISYAERLSLHLDGQTADLYFPPIAHTDSDTYVFLREANVLSAGDFFTSNRYPHFYGHQGGSIDGTIKALNGLIALANDQTKIVPGHGPLADKALLVAYRDMAVDVRGKVAAVKTAGKTVDDAVAANFTAAYDGRWAQDSFRRQDPKAGAEFIHAIWRTLP